MPVQVSWLYNLFLKLFEGTLKKTIGQGITTAVSQVLALVTTHARMRPMRTLPRRHTTTCTHHMHTSPQSTPHHNPHTTRIDTIPVAVSVRPHPPQWLRYCQQCQSLLARNGR